MGQRMLQAFVMEKTGRWHEFAWSGQGPQSRGQLFRASVLTWGGSLCRTGVRIRSRYHSKLSAILARPGGQESWESPGQESWESGQESWESGQESWESPGQESWESGQESWESGWQEGQRLSW